MDGLLLPYTRFPTDPPLPLCRNANIRNPDEHIVYGAVKAANGVALEGAIVSVPGYRSSARTDARGEYLLVLNPRPSGGGELCYMVSIRKPGFEPDAACVCGREGADARHVNAIMTPGEDRQPIRQCGPTSELRLKKSPGANAPVLTPVGTPDKCQGPIPRGATRPR